MQKHLKVCVCVCACVSVCVCVCVYFVRASMIKDKSEKWDDLSKSNARESGRLFGKHQVFNSSIY